MKPKTDEQIELSEQDEEFLEAINELSENKKNIVIAYMKDKCEAKADEIRINVMNDIKIWMAGRDCDIKVIDDILEKHTK